MGATIITNKLAAATKGADGKMYYILYEETYDKNTHPHTPDWSCVYIGTIEGALRRIFLSASSCESGMLRSRKGDILPENYIASWFKELANPVGFTEPNFEVKLGDGFYAVIPTDKQDWAVDAFIRHGHTDLADRLVHHERLSLDFTEYAPVLAEIFDGDRVSPWRLVRHLPQWTNRYLENGYAPTPVRMFAATPPKVLSVADGRLLVADAESAWRCEGYAYSVAGSYIAQYWTIELAEPGSYKIRIKAFRDALNNAPKMPSCMKVVVDMSVELNAYEKRTVEENRALGKPTGSVYEIDVTPEMLKDHSLAWRICNLPRVCTTWVTGEGAEKEVENFEGNQLGLFA